MQKKKSFKYALNKIGPIIEPCRNPEKISLNSLLTLLIQTHCLRRHLSHVTKRRIFKTLNLRRKADRNFRSNLLENHFRHLKLYSNPPM